MNENITIIIPTVGINYKNALEKCLNSVLTTISKYNNVNLLLVVNGMSEIIYKELMNFLDNINYNKKNIHINKIDKPIGYIDAINNGLNTIYNDIFFNKTEYILFLNDDTEVFDNWLDLLIKKFKENSNLSICGAMSLPFMDLNIKEFPVGFCTLIKKEFLLNLENPYLSTEFGIGYGDDIDLYIRLKQKGYDSFCYINGYNIETNQREGHFPIIHNAENTMHSGELFSIDEWNKHTEKCKKILLSKYQEKVKIIIPTFQRYNKLEKTLDSVINQTYDNLEILICSDGKDEKLIKCIDNYKNKNINNKHINSILLTNLSTHKGGFGGNCRIHLIDNYIKDDDWVCFVDDDNEIYSDYIYKLWKSTFLKDVKISYCLINHIEENRIIPSKEVPIGTFVWREIDSLNYFVKGYLAKKNSLKWLHSGNNVTHDFDFINACSSGLSQDEIFFVDEVLGQHGQKQNILTITFTYNEEKIIPYFLSYYSQFSDKIIVIDGGSTDNTINIINEFKNKYQNIELQQIISEKLNDVDLMELRNNFYKNYRYDYDWVIVCDCDEFLYGDLNLKYEYQKDIILNKLENFRKKRVTIPIINGYEVYSKEFNFDDKSITNLNNYNTIFENFIHLNKNIIFNPKCIDINYEPGCHKSKPIGNVKYSLNNEKLYLLHYKYIDYKYFIEKSKKSYERLSEDNKKYNYGCHYKEHMCLSLENYKKLSSNSFEIFKNMENYMDEFKNKLQLLDDFVYREIYEWNCYNVSNEDLKDRNILELGSHYGYFTFLAKDNLANKIVCVEANNQNIKIFKNLIDDKYKTSLDELNIKLFNNAISDEDDKIVCFEAEGSHCKRTDNKTEVNCKSITITELLKEFDENDNNLILKSDVEGSEFPAILSTDKNLMRRFKTILIEIHGERISGNSIDYLERYIVERLGYDIKWKGEYFTYNSKGEKIINQDIKVYKFERNDNFNKESKINITVGISTRNRYFTTLPLVLNSLINQTYLPNEIIIMDDSDHKEDLRKYPVYQYIFELMNKKGITYKVLFTPSQGQVKNHQYVKEISQNDWIFRIDDDAIPELNVLEKLVTHIDKNVGVISCLILDPKTYISDFDCKNNNKISEIYNVPNTQWILQQNRIIDAEHIYSSFLYNKNINVNYCSQLSVVGHREETIFTHEIFRNNYKLLIDTSVKIWHYRNPEGGIRVYNDNSLWEKDEQLFQRKLENWNKKIEENKTIIMESGLGDHLVFLTILDKLLKKYKKLNIVTFYPDIFKDYKDNVNILLPFNFVDIVGEYNYNKIKEKTDIYKFMYEESFKNNIMNLEEAFYKFFVELDILSK